MSCSAGTGEQQREQKESGNSGARGIHAGLVYTSGGASPSTQSAASCALRDGGQPKRICRLRLLLLRLPLRHRRQVHILHRRQGWQADRQAAA